MKKSIRIGLHLIDEAVYKFQKKTVRKMILKDHKRPDGREINTDPSIVRRSRCTSYRSWFRIVSREDRHRFCNVTTLAPLSEKQKIDGLDENVTI